MLRLTSLVLAVALVLIGTGKASAAFLPITGNTADGTVDVNGLPQDFPLTQLRSGVGGNDLRGLALVYFFELPTLPSRDSLVSAQLRLTFLDVTRATVFTAPDFNADLFGLDTLDADDPGQRLLRRQRGGEWRHASRARTDDADHGARNTKRDGDKFHRLHPIAVQRRWHTHRRLRGVPHQPRQGSSGWEWTVPGLRVRFRRQH